MRKITMKEQVLQFVETKGSARFTDIQKFIMDTNFGEGTYASGYKIVKDHKWDSESSKWVEVMVKRNTNRGYFCGAFSSGYYSKTLKKYQSGGYFLRGENRLVKNSDGKYSVIRESK